MKKASAFFWAFILLLAIIMVVSCSKGSTTGPSEEKGYTIQGAVEEGNSSLPGVSIRLTGSPSFEDQTTITNEYGAYIFSGIADGGYAIIPSKAGYIFDPASLPVTVSGSNKTVRVIIATQAGTGNGYIVSGIIREGDFGLSGVSVQLTGNGVSKTATTSSGGVYIFGDLANGTYIVTPSKSGYKFFPSSAQVVVNGANASAADISATEQGGTQIIPNITFVSIPGGTFQMGSWEGDVFEKPVHTVTVSSFEMSAYEVTNAQYAAYLNAALASGEIIADHSLVFGKGQEYITFDTYYGPINRPWISYSCNIFSVASGKENWPVVFVTWEGAKAFALYYGFDLPTEAEWEYACCGGKQYTYGTDDGTINSGKANYNGNVGSPRDVGSYPKNPYGLYDMSGNVWEWFNDLFGHYSSESVLDPTGPTSTQDSIHGVRGGSWSSSSYHCRSAYRVGKWAWGGDIGFRVVRRPGGKQY
ncbi:MAG: SUMF1/EgtB/PvdO family nonheme iron enzyme [Patescibacteria group bacterium]|nr:SUMF1/EgtB/PvdO family nonheme iron enzyme [Patescibacteria group bacterium]MDD5294659.1 SUMF1/EgtB/PvdO family nonheme iron enzyme [Patescibacteria group bacterium]MDD5554710.1 SUMF1/EgtB/PvdO family nonheme iron enzyme [Patescibacteria group bacterium]